MRRLRSRDVKVRALLDEWRRLDPGSFDVWLERLQVLVGQMKLKRRLP